MATIKLAVSLPEALFTQLESLAQETNTPRSQMVAAALEDYLRRHRIERLREQINAAYADGLDDEERALLEAHRRLQRNIVETEEQ